MDAVGEVRHLGLELGGVAEGIDAPGCEPLPHVRPRHDHPEARAGEDAREDVRHEAEAVPLVGAGLEGGAEGKEGPALAEGGGVIVSVPVRIDGPAGGEALPLAAGDFELASGHCRRGHVEGERLATGDGRGEGDGVRAEGALGAAGGNGEHGRIATGHADESAGGRALGVVAGRPEVASVADGDHADAVRFGAGDAAVHRVDGDDDAHASVAVEGEGGGGLTQHADRWRGVHAAVAQAGHVAPVPGEVGDTVRLDALQVGVDEHLGGDGGIGGRHAEVIEGRGRVVAQGAGIEALAGIGHRSGIVREDWPERERGGLGRLPRSREDRCDRSRFPWWFRSR